MAWTRVNAPPVQMLAEAPGFAGRASKKSRPTTSGLLCTLAAAVNRRRDEVEAVGLSTRSTPLEPGTGCSLRTSGTAVITFVESISSHARRAAACPTDRRVDGQREEGHLAHLGLGTGLRGALSSDRPMPAVSPVGSPGIPGPWPRSRGARHTSQTPAGPNRTAQRSRGGWRRATGDRRAPAVRPRRGSGR